MKGAPPGWTGAVSLAGGEVPRKRPVRKRPNQDLRSTQPASECRRPAEPAVISVIEIELDGSLGGQRNASIFHLMPEAIRRDIIPPRPAHNFANGVRTGPAMLIREKKGEVRGFLRKNTAKSLISLVTPTGGITFRD